MEGNRTQIAREMMYGTREPFAYIECGTCGCLHIEEVPRDLDRHYREYYSLREPRRRITDGPRNLLKRKRAEYLHGGSSAVGWAVAKVFGRPEHWAWLAKTGASLDSRIADIGCGQGTLLRSLRVEGFRDLTGIDPFISEAVHEPGLRILKSRISEVDETFDLLMLHHSLEHMPDHDDVMRRLRRMVSGRGAVVIRIPLVAYAWRTYGVDWVQLDAPRHVVLHTERSMRLLAERAGFAVAGVEYDSTEFQFVGSERYRRGITLWEPEDPSHPLFNRSEVLSFKERARLLNAQSDGDQACFYLSPR